MPTYRLTYRPELNREPEQYDADAARVEGRHWVLRRGVLVAGQPRDMVVRRVPTVEVETVIET